MAAFDPLVKGRSYCKDKPVRVKVHEHGHEYRDGKLHFRHAWFDARLARKVTIGKSLRKTQVPVIRCVDGKWIEETYSADRVTEW